MPVYVDTNILVYLLEQHPPYSEFVADVLESSVAQSGQLTTSTIAIAEFLAGTVSSSLETLHQVPQLYFVPLDENLVVRAAELQRKESLKIGDAIHLATALQQKATLLFTNDTQLVKIAKKYLPVKTLEN